MSDLSEFVELSELVEEVFLRFGLDVFAEERGGGYWIPCSGRLLYMAVCYQSTIERVFRQHETAIILALGDRTTRVDYGPYPCTGITSHKAAETIIYNLFNDFTEKVVAALAEVLEPEMMNQRAPEWESLTTAQRQVVASIESAAVECHSAWGELSDKIRTERVLYLESQPKEWVPKPSDIEKVKNAIAGMKYKTTNLEAIRIAAKMQKQRVSIILKLIGHNAE